MYLRPDEVARVLEKAGFTVDVVTNKTYGYRRGENYVYVNREARMGRTALIIHPRLKDRSSSLADPASDIKTCDHYQNFPLYLGGETHEHYGIPHGFSSRYSVRTLSERAFWRRKTPGGDANLRLSLMIAAHFKQATTIIQEVAINRAH
ncbi:conserved hypothetical protein [Salmonella enterica subsp. enterica serovar Paratyphi A]|nr:conserved hypothetical protein [Salmonella enterica subsp. enterica serovar Paratyphi A]